MDKTGVAETPETMNRFNPNGGVMNPMPLILFLGDVVIPRCVGHFLKFIKLTQ